MDQTGLEKRGERAEVVAVVYIEESQFYDKKVFGCVFLVSQVSWK